MLIMEKITKRLTEALENSQVKALFSVARCFDTSLPSHTANYEKFKKLFDGLDALNTPNWVQFFRVPRESVILKDALLKMIDGKQAVANECLSLIMPVLRSIMYATSAMIPNINEETAWNLALGHPVALWLFDYADHIDVLCSVAMVLNGFIEQDPCIERIPQCLIRLPNALIRCREVLFVHINAVHVKSAEACRKEYLGLYLKQEKKE